MPVDCQMPLKSWESESKDNKREAERKSTSIATSTQLVSLMIFKEMLGKILVNTFISPSAGLKEIRLKIYSAEREVGLWLVTLSCLFYGGLNVVGIELNGATIILIIAIAIFHCL